MAPRDEWNKLGFSAGALQKGAYSRSKANCATAEFTAAESDRPVRIAEIYANSILAFATDPRSSPLLMVPIQS